MPFRISLAAAVALAACSQEEQHRAASMTPDQLSREIEAVRELKPQDDPSRPMVLQPGDWKAEHGVPGCSFVESGGLTLLANRQHAVLRLRNRVLTLKAAGPVDRSAAFYAAAAVTVSVGVLKGESSRAGASRMAVRFQTAKQPSVAEGKWICR